MQAMSIQSVIQKSVYFFIGVSLASAFFSLVADLVLIAIFIRIFDLPLYESFNSIFWYPLIGSLIGFIFGILAKAITRNDEVLSKQRHTAENLMYLNVLILVINFFSVCGLAYYFAQ